MSVCRFEYCAEAARAGGSAPFDGQRRRAAAITPDALTRSHKHALATSAAPPKMACGASEQCTESKSYSLRSRMRLAVVGEVAAHLALGSSSLLGLRLLRSFLGPPAQVLFAFDAVVRNVANSIRFQEECDVLSLRLSKCRGPIDLSEFKARGGRSQPSRKARKPDLRPRQRVM